MNSQTHKLLVLFSAVALLCSSAIAQQDTNAAQTQAAALLNKNQFHAVTVSVADGILTLNGTVDQFKDKADAEKRVHKVKGISKISNRIEIAGPTVPDAILRQQLGEKIALVAFDRIGHADIFNAMTIGVNNGVVTLGGHAHTYMDRDDAVALVSTYPGVKDLISDIQVDPASFMDERIRFAVARSIYGYPLFNKYALDPARPIRISVQSGNVALYGTVYTQAEKDAAGLRTNSVSGVFSVKNYLQIAGQPAAKKE